MDTARIVHAFLQHMPDFFKRKSLLRDSRRRQNFSSEYSLFASTTNLSIDQQDQSIYDTEGGLLYTQTAQSNLSLFNVSCDSLVIDDLHCDSKLPTKKPKHYTSSTEIHLEMKKIVHRSTMVFPGELLIHSSAGTLQRWQGLDLLNTYT